jgi:hypothetical protein
MRKNLMDFSKTKKDKILNDMKIPPTRDSRQDDVSSSFVTLSSCKQFELSVIDKDCN